MTIYNSIQQFTEQSTSNSNHVIFTGFRPSEPIQNKETIGFTLWHLLQLQKLKHLANITKASIFCIIADVQWYSDYATANHAKSLGDITQRYLKELTSSFDANDEHFYLFLESQVRTHIDSLKWLIEHHIPLAEVFTDRFEQRLERSQNLGRSAMIWARLRNVWQATQLIWSWTTLVPAWIDQQESTRLANIAIQHINNEYTLELPKIIWIADQTLLPWTDGETMSTSRWNTLHTLMGKEQLSKKLHSTPDIIIMEYHRQFYENGATLDYTYNRNETIAFLEQLILHKHTLNNISEKLDLGKQAYTNRILSTETQIQQAIFE